MDNAAPLTARSASDNVGIGGGCRDWIKGVDCEAIVGILGT